MTFSNDHSKLKTIEKETFSKESAFEKIQYSSLFDIIIILVNCDIPIHHPFLSSETLDGINIFSIVDSEKI